MSKLALLAQKRKEAAQARETSTSKSSNVAAIPIETMTVVGSSTSPDIPLSKLAQRMATVKAGRTKEQVDVEKASELSDQHPGNHDTLSSTLDDSLFPACAAHAALDNIHNIPSPTASRRRSPFFDILTTQIGTSASIADPPAVSEMHLPFVRNPAELERRIREAFGPDAASPDDIVLRARQGRAGVGDQAQKLSQPPR